MKKQKAPARVGSMRIVRRFTANPEQGMTALLAGSTAEGMPLQSMSRKGNKVVVAVYSPNTKVSDGADGKDRS